MSLSIIVDAGPLVALVDRRDKYYDWATEQFALLEPPLLVCEAVLLEASHLARHLPQGQASIMEFLIRGLVTVAFDLEHEAQAIYALLRKYRDVPMSLADSCLVRMSELHPGSVVLTVDSDFHIYRQHGRRTIPTIMPVQT
ncbi:MAG: PIN domain-containing protein [Planctomycetaceae bacterium]|nr:PIN domain-containing protein [Planctomycetaceae bacterium]